MSIKKRATIYTRVSMEDQAREGHSLDVQREYLANSIALEN